MKIFLIGLPGSGKTTVGRELSKKLNLNFYDIDALVEKESLMFIDDLVEQYGIEKFRELENKVLKELNVDKGIISCGGGIVENRDNKNYMDGIVIYLDVNNEVIEGRIKNDYPRPLLKESSIEDIQKKRFLLYQHFSDYNISNAKTVNETVLSIIDMLKTKEFVS